MYGGYIITFKEVLMGRDEEFPLSNELFYNLLDLLPRVNLIRFSYGKPLTVSSGYRPDRYNKAAGGAKNSSHLVCKAVDFKDADGEFAKWCLENMELLKKAKLYLEDPEHTKGWVHLQTTPTKQNPFNP